MKPRLFEALIAGNGEFKEHIETQKHKIASHPFLKRYCEVGVKEGLFSDSTQAAALRYCPPRTGEMLGKEW